MPALEIIVAVAMLIALIGYVTLGGADFGAGVWDLLATGPRQHRQRRIIADAIGPIWEANHVWLILAIVILFTGFPLAFSIIMTALHIPVTIMLIGIVFRGVSFVFRAYDSQDDRVQRRWSRVFAISSTITPIMLGMIVGGISIGTIQVEGGMVTSGWFNAWVNLFALAVGGFTLSLFAFLAAVYLTVEAIDDPEVQRDFRTRALGAAVALGGSAFLVSWLGGGEAPALGERLFGSWWSWPVQIATGFAATGTIVALLVHRYFVARTLAVIQTALILAGWGFSINPDLVAGSVSIADAAAPAITLRLLIGGLTAGALVLFPSLYYLFRVFKGQRAFILLDLKGEHRAPSTYAVDA